MVQTYRHAGGIVNRTLVDKARVSRARSHAIDTHQITEQPDANATLSAWWSTGELRVAIPGNFTSEARLNVYAATGQLVYAQRTGAAAGSTVSVRMDPGAGMFLLSLEEGNARRTAKVVVP